MPRRLLITALLLFAALVLRPAVAQDDAGLIEPPELEKESIVLAGEETPRQGYIVSEDEERMEFLEIVQRPGRRVSLVSRPIPLAQIQPGSIVRLGEAERAKLVEWIDQVKRRVEIEAGLLEAVELREQPGDSGPLWVYEGPWFTLESNADDETTRRCVVRIEQVFRAYPFILRPRTEPATPLQIRLFGSMEAYNGHLAQQGIEIGNPAYYDVQENLIVAGGELSLFAENLAEVRQQNEQLLAELETRENELRGKLASLETRLKGLGYTSEEIITELAIARRAEEAEIARLRQAVLVADRQNTRSFNQLSEQMFRRLYHEALHAYIENYVFPHAHGEVPPWLNEGLALIFENHQLEGDMLRIDMPHPVALAQLESDFSEGAPLPLRSVILAENEDFHFLSDDDQLASRYYAYAWGLTWYLTMTDAEGQPKLSEVEQALNPTDHDSSPEARIARFERLVGMPLAEFEPEWRVAMREMW